MQNGQDRDGLEQDGATVETLTELAGDELAGASGGRIVVEPAPKQRPKPTKPWPKDFPCC